MLYIFGSIYAFQERFRESAYRLALLNRGS